LFWGEEVRLTPDYADQIDYETGLMDLSWVLINDSAVVLHTIADRALLRWRDQHWDLTLGRQRINWGMSTVWNPNDLFNAFNFFDFDYEERPGSDAIRIRRILGGLSSAELVYSRGAADTSTVAAGLYRFNTRGYDIQLLAGSYRTDFALGVGWAGFIGGAGFRGEATWFQPWEDFWNAKSAFSATVGTDYSFANGYYLGASLLYCSEGVTESFPPERFYNQQLSPRLLMPYRYNILLQGSRQWMPLFSTQLNLIYSPGADAFLLFPVLTYSVSNNWDLDVVGQSFFAPLEGAFRNQGNAVFCGCGGRFRHHQFL
jgi:hypothetical protein